MTAPPLLRGAWFAPVGTGFETGFDGRLGAGWSDRLPGSPVDDYWPGELTEFGPPVWPSLVRRRWEFTAILDLGQVEPADRRDPPCRVWLPRVELKEDEYGRGEKLVVWTDPRRLVSG